MITYAFLFIFVIFNIYSSIGYLAILKLPIDKNIPLVTIVTSFATFILPGLYVEYFWQIIGAFILYNIIGMILFNHETNKYTKYEH